MFEGKILSILDGGGRKVQNVEKPFCPFIEKSQLGSIWRPDRLTPAYGKGQHTDGKYHLHFQHSLNDEEI